MMELEHEAYLPVPESGQLPAAQVKDIRPVNGKRARIGRCIIDTTSDFSAVKSMPFSTFRLPKDFSMPLASIIVDIREY